MGHLRVSRPADSVALARLVKDLFDYHRQLQGAPPLSDEEARETARHWVEQGDVEVLLYGEGEPESETDP
jgi:hypothetical protein